MIFQISKRGWPEITPSSEWCQWWEKGSIELYYKAENIFFKSKSLDDSPSESILNLMIEIEANADITIYVGLISKEEQWFKAGAEAFEYDGMRRINLSEYLEFVKYKSFPLRGIRVKQLDSESGEVKMGEEYFDGETCMLDEFDVYFTTDPIEVKPCTL